MIYKLTRTGMLASQKKFSVLMGPTVRMFDAVSPGWKHLNAHVIDVGVIYELPGRVFVLGRDLYV